MKRDRKGVQTVPKRYTRRRWSRQLSLAAESSPATPDIPRIAGIQKEFCRRMTGILPDSEIEMLTLLARVGISGLGYGAKVVKGRVRRLDCLRVYVPRKKTSGLTRKRRIPKRFGGVATDVIEMPHVDPHTVFPGASIGLGRVSGGTFGCVVKKNQSYYVLSNNHVLANFNSARIGDEILQPSAFDGGKPPAFARLSDFEIMVFGDAAVNLIDAAIAEIVTPAQVSPQIYMIGKIGAPTATAFSGMRVKKFGCATELRSGAVEGCLEHFQMKCPGERIALFINQVAVNGDSALFSDAGDSGSLVVTANTNQPVGLLIGANALAGLSYFTPIQRVLDRFQVTIAR